VKFCLKVSPEIVLEGLPSVCYEQEATRRGDFALWPAMALGCVRNGVLLEAAKVLLKGSEGCINLVVLVKVFPLEMEKLK
jgi:hypothetical protein